MNRRSGSIEVHIGYILKNWVAGLKTFFFISGFYSFLSYKKNSQKRDADTGKYFESIYTMSLTLIDVWWSFYEYKKILGRKACKFKVVLNYADLLLIILFLNLFLMKLGMRDFFIKCFPASVSQGSYQ